MGTNYHTIINDCDKCERSDSIHLGKSSAGWSFTFQYNGGKYYKNIVEMKEWLSGKEIRNEYGEDVPYDDFWEMVASKMDSLKTHARDAGDQDAQIIDGHSFIDCEFS